jgi:cellulose biosynthesis protein BcsQ
MAASVILFGNFKGGVGKTTNSTMTAIELARRGHKTLVVDLDPQGNASNLFLKTKQNLEESSVAFDKTLMAAIQDQDLRKALVTVTDNLDILASAPDFSLYPRFMESKLSNYEDRVRYFNELLQPLKSVYDYIFIDVPPTISLITDSALYATDYCIIILQTQERSLQGAEAFLKYIQDQVIDTFQAPNLDVLGILPVLLKNGAPVDLSTLAAAEEEFGQENMFKTTIKNMERLKRYDVHGVTFNDRYDKRVQNVYAAVTDELLTRIQD